MYVETQLDLKKKTNKHKHHQAMPLQKVKLRFTVHEAHSSGNLLNLCNLLIISIQDV